jgi:ActR/RegA family two-component response regulator
LRFLIVGEDPEYRQVLRYHLEVEWPAAVIEQHAPQAGELVPARLDNSDLDLILLAYPASPEAGLASLRSLLARDGCPPVIVFASNGDELTAVDALKAGAANYFPKNRVRHQRLIDAVRAELRAERLDPTGALLVDARSLRGARPRRLIAKLYAGDLSSVYLAEDEGSGERVALKVLRHVPDAGGGRLFDRFLQEYEVIARIRHPNVVRIFDLGIADDHAYIAMEYLAAGSLAERLQRPLPPDVAVRYARQIASALGAIHDAGVLHRDLKPANIMFRDDGTLALIDFGLAKQMRLEAVITGTGQIFGTPYYMSPEQGHAEATDERSDIYGLGCIFYEMLTGDRPFSASSPMGVIYKHAHAPRPELGGSAAYLQPVLSRMLAASPAARYQNAAALLADLEAASVASRR